MPDFTKFTIEEDFIVGLHAARPYNSDKTVSIPPENPDNGELPLSLETQIARTLDFPSNEEYEALSARNEQLMGVGLQTRDDLPDITRNVKLRITVEVLDE